MRSFLPTSTIIDNANKQDEYKTRRNKQAKDEVELKRFTQRPQPSSSAPGLSSRRASCTPTHAVAALPPTAAPRGRAQRCAAKSPARRPRCPRGSRALRRTRSARGVNEHTFAPRRVSGRTLKMACICVSVAHGCSPVSISTTRHPTLQISALRVCPLCLTTSGAIQNTEPCSDGRCMRLPVSRSCKEKKRKSIKLTQCKLQGVTHYLRPSWRSRNRKS